MYSTSVAFLRVRRITVKNKRKNKVLNLIIAHLKEQFKAWVSWHLRKQVGVIAYPMYSTSVAFLRVRRITVKNKRKNKVLNLIIAHLKEQFKAWVWSRSWSQSLEWEEVLESRAGAEPEPVILKSPSWSHRFYC